MTAKRVILPAFVLVASLCFSVSLTTSKASAACAALPTDRGTITSTVSIPADGTYRVWSRIKAPDTTNNAFLMQIDQTLCNTTVGGASIPANTWTWVDYQAGSTTNKINATLTAGNHTLTMAGSEDNVQVDRVIFTQDTTCVPTGTGDNCANPPDTTPPTIAITAPANNATISATTNVTVTAADDVAVTKVEFYVQGVLKATDTAAPYTYSFNPTTFAAGNYQLTAIAYDAADNSTTSSVVNVTVPDTTAPIISAISSGSLSQTSATIGWSTNESSDSQVSYGTTTAYGTSTTLNTTKLTTHSVGLTGLTANTLYHYVVKSRDAAGNLATSADGTFTTLPPAADTTAPAVSITAPTNASTIFGTVIVTANASDNVGVVGVQFKLGGNILGAEDTTAPYAVSWNTAGVANGTYVLTALARDAAGNQTTSTNVSVTVTNTGIAAADINSDGHITLRDFSLLVGSSFPRTGTNLGRADINGDGRVDMQDFALLVGSQFPR